MPSFTVNICVLTLVLLSFQQICLSRPHSRSRRSIVKDYFTPDPLVFSSDKFEKGEDGKYYLKKSAHKSDSEVKYEGENGAVALPEDPKAVEVAIVSKDSSEQGESLKTETLKEEMTETLVIEEAPLKPTPPVVEEAKVESEIAKDKVVIEEKTETTKINKEKAPFTPTDPKFVVPTKPDSKDEISLKTDLPPIDVDEKVDEKIFIGQVPHLYPRVIPVNGNSRLPVLIPMRKVSYGTVSVIPIPPMDGSDRLPLPYDDEIVGEGPHESEATDEISQPIEDKRKDYEFNPLMGIHLPFLSFRTFLKDFKDADKLEKEKQAKVVDVLGKKFLMQSSVMKQPTGDNSHMYVRFMSVKPLEEVKPEVAKEETVERGIEQEKREDSREMEMKKEIEGKETEILKKEEIPKESEAEKEAEILKAEETEIKMDIDKEVPKEVVLENMESTSMEKVEDPEIVVVSETKETKMLKAEDSVLASEETSTAVKSEEGFTATIEKTDTENVEKKLDSVELENEETKVELSEKSDESDEVTASSNDDEMKIESTDVMKKEKDKTMEVDSKKSFFMVEKNKKLKSKEESEEHKKSIKKSEKKKKKCKCEEKDSDSDDDDE